MELPVRLLLLSAAAILSYFSWKRITLGTIWDREMILRDRFDGISLKKSKFDLLVVRVQVSKPSKIRNKIRPYIPILSNILGDTFVEIQLQEKVDVRFETPDLDKVKKSERYQDLPIESMEWRKEKDVSYTDSRNLDIRFSTVNPNVVEDSIIELTELFDKVTQTD